MLLALTMLVIVIVGCIKSCSAPPQPTIGAAAPPGGVQQIHDSLVGKWIGTYRCGQGVTGLRLTLQKSQGLALTGTFEFFPERSSRPCPFREWTPRGAYSAAGLDLVGDHWIKQPSGYLMVGLHADPRAVPTREAGGRRHRWREYLLRVQAPAGCERPRTLRGSRSTRASVDVSRWTTRAAVSGRRSAPGGLILALLGGVVRRHPPAEPVRGQERRVGRRVERAQLRAAATLAMPSCPRSRWRRGRRGRGPAGRRTTPDLLDVGHQRTTARARAVDDDAPPLCGPPRTGSPMSGAPRGRARPQ